MPKSIHHNPDQCAFNFDALSSQPVEPLTYTPIEPTCVPILKQCYACRVEFPATKQFFYADNQKRDGFSPRCKTCFLACREEALSKPRKPRDILPKGQRRCTKCHQVFPETIEFFSVQSGRKSGLKPGCKACMNAENRIYEATHTEQRRQYLEEHKEERYARMRRYGKAHRGELRLKQRQSYLLHKEERQAYVKRYNAANREQIRSRNNRYQAEHREQIRTQRRVYAAAHRDELSERRKRYLRTERGRMVGRAHRHRREAQKRAIEGTLTASEIRIKLKAQKYRCYYAGCGHAKFQREKGRYIYHLEHTIPISRTEHNPRHDADFVVLSCPSCNMRKGNKLPSEWFEGGRMF